MIGTSPAAPTVELLHIDGCPHHDVFLPHLLGLLADHHLALPVTMIKVESDEDARRLRFLGSPSLRVDGRDVEPGAADRIGYGMQCRVYPSASGLTGAPDDAWILAALLGMPASRDDGRLGG